SHRSPRLRDQQEAGPHRPWKLPGRGGPMRTGAWPCLLLGAVAACGSGSLSVSFEIPAAYRERVASARLRLIAPQRAGFGCDDIAFHEVAPALVLAAQLRELVIPVGQAGPSDIGAIERSGIKLLLATIEDAAGVPQLAGC